MTGFKRGKASTTGAAAAGAACGAGAGSGTKRLTAADMPRRAKISRNRNASTNPMPRNIRVKPSPNSRAALLIKKPSRRRHDNGAIYDDEIIRVDFPEPPRPEPLVIIIVITYYHHYRAIYVIRFI